MIYLSIKPAVAEEIGQQSVYFMLYDISENGKQAAFPLFHTGRSTCGCCRKGLTPGRKHAIVDKKLVITN